MTPDGVLTSSEFDAARAREDFPTLAPGPTGRRVVYLDSAASALKPRPVIEAMSEFYLHEYANIHRGVYALSQRSTERFEAARGRVAQFIGAKSPAEVVFVRGATEAINLVAATWGRVHLRAGDEVIVSAMEHHANIVPWQLLGDQTGAVLRVAPMSDAAELDLDALERLFSPRTRLVSVVHVSNALGTVNPVSTIVEMAHARGVPVLIDASQSVPHMPVDVAQLGCDFLVFSGHKVYGPTGIGVLWAREDILREMPPYQGGGDMIRNVSFERTTYADPPARFEAGTPHIAGAVGLGLALDYLEAQGRDAVAAHEASLLVYAERQLGELPGLRIVGAPKRRAGGVSFVHGTAHPADLGTLLDKMGICVRTGHHCAEPVMRRLGLAGTARASFGLYNTREDVDALVLGLDKAIRLLG
jgi:cysteine desulfurase/selenocysteine lyase